MPDKQTIDRAREDAREGKSPSTQAGEFVREEMDHIREGKHGARSTKQAIAIGLVESQAGGSFFAAAERQSFESFTHKGRAGFGSRELTASAIHKEIARHDQRFETGRH